MTQTRVEKFLACKHTNVQSFTECCMDCGENRYISVGEILKREAKYGNLIKEEEKQMLRDIEKKEFQYQLPKVTYELMQKVQKTAKETQEEIKVSISFDANSSYFEFNTKDKNIQLNLNDVHPDDFKAVEEILKNVKENYEKNAPLRIAHSGFIC